MKRKFLCLVIATIFIMTACGKDGVDSSLDKAEIADSSAENEDANTNAGEADDISSTGDDGTNLASTEEIDIWADNNELIKSQVADIVNNSESLQDELADVGELADWYIDKGSLDTQAEMTQTSLWPYVVWDTELNNLWSRMSDELDATTKEEVLSEQRRWVSLKEKAANLATIENEGGSIRPMLVNIDLEEYTINRCYKLADIYMLRLLMKALRYLKRNRGIYMACILMMRVQVKFIVL